tara:strand:- start:134 stop:370 length:237 start_codon:yes stop_codon:yes gene_type:complete
MNYETNPDKYSYSSFASYSNKDVDKQYSNAYQLREKKVISKEPYEKYVSIRSAVRAPFCYSGCSESCNYERKEYDGVS